MVYILVGADFVESRVIRRHEKSRCFPTLKTLSEILTSLSALYIPNVDHAMYTPRRRWPEIQDTIRGEQYGDQVGVRRGAGKAVMVPKG